jgi:hypothetical protein
MIKTITLKLDENEHHKLKTVKDKTGLSWERFVLSLLKGGLDNGKNKC